MRNKTSVEYIYEIMREEELPYFTIQNATTQKMHMNNVTDEANVENAIAKIMRFFQHNFGVYSINVRDTAQVNAKGARKSMHFSVSNVEPADADHTRTIAGVAQTPSNDRVMDLLIAQMQENKENNNSVLQMMLENMKQNNDLQLQIQKLQLERQEKDSNKQFNEFALSTLGGLFSDTGSNRDINGIATGVQGVGENIQYTDMSQGNKNEKHARIQAAVRKLLAIDANFASNLEKLANLAQKDKPTYDAAVKYLNSL